MPSVATRHSKPWARTSFITLPTAVLGQMIDWDDWSHGRYAAQRPRPAVDYLDCRNRWLRSAARVGEAARVVADAAEEVAPLINMGTSGGATAGKAFPKAVRDAAFAGNPEQVCVFYGRPGTGSQVTRAISRPRGGDATVENAQLACGWCNPSKGAGVAPKNPPPDYEGAWPPSRWPDALGDFKKYMGFPWGM
jgi:hypothetical protein